MRAFVEAGLAEGAVQALAAGFAQRYGGAKAEKKEREKVGKEVERAFLRVPDKMEVAG